MTQTEYALVIIIVLILILIWKRERKSQSFTSDNTQLKIEENGCTPTYGIRTPGLKDPYITVQNKNECAQLSKEKGIDRFFMDGNKCFAAPDLIKERCTIYNKPLYIVQ